MYMALHAVLTRTITKPQVRRDAISALFSLTMDCVVDA